MSLSFYDAYREISKTPKESYYADLQAQIDSQFSNSSTINTIQEETSVGSGIYSNISVRLNKVFDPKTGTKLGDEYRKILYQTPVSNKLGIMYQFDGSYWVGGNADLTDLPTSSMIAYRCNDSLKWYDEDGVLRTQPIFIDADNSGMGLSEDKYMVLTDGDIKGALQLNQYTTKIIEGQEFLLGRSGKRAKYRVSFEDDLNYGAIFLLKFERYQINTEVDNLELGIANYANRPIFTLTVSPITSQISIGDSLTMDYQILDKDSIEVVKDITWISSDEAIATVDSNGVVTALDNGVVSITATMTNNPSVFDSTDVEVTATPIDNFEIVVDNGSLDIIRTDTQIFNWSMLNNGIEVASNFTFSINPSSTAISSDYVLTIIDANSYSIKNINEGKTVVIDILEDGGLTKQVTYRLVGYW